VTATGSPPILISSGSSTATASRSRRRPGRRVTSAAAVEYGGAAISDDAADRLGQLVEARSALGATDQVAEERRVRPFAALVGCDSGQVEEVAAEPSSISRSLAGVPAAPATASRAWLSHASMARMLVPGGL
jgi:hypothetical protein